MKNEWGVICEAACLGKIWEFFKILPGVSDVTAGDWGRSADVGNGLFIAPDERYLVCKA